MTFMDEYWAGDTDGATARWHIQEWLNRGDTVPLWEHLGMTLQEYRRWIDHGLLPERGAP